MTADRVAAIDIGTNTLLVLIAERAPDGDLVAVHEDCRFGRLGKGLDSAGNLDPEAIARSLDMLRAYADAIAAHGVTRVAAVGTQALREAGNRAAFLDPARDILGGVDVEVIAGEREAELVYAAAARSFPDLAETGLAVADVGGGSTEIIAGRGGNVDSRVSVPIGSVRLAERHLVTDPPTADQMRALCADADAALADAPIPTGLPLIGTAGTATTMAAVELALAEWDPVAVQGFELTRARLERQLARYLELPLEQRKQLRGLEPQRADVIPAGAAIFDRLMARAEVDKLIINDRGVRWGLAYELADSSPAAG